MKENYERFLKRALLFTLIVHLSMAGFATTYYISNSGSDSNNGNSTSTAWKSLTKVNSVTFSAGDQILFNRGESFYGSLKINQSGSSGSSITIGAYGNGANPIITGLTSVTTWTNLGSNIWESTSAVSTLSTLNMVVINNVNTGMGRSPNSGFYYFQSHSGSTSITSNNLTGTPNWTGAELAFNNTEYTIQRRPINAQSGSTLTFTQDPTVAYIQKDGLKFIIQNDPRTLDIQNEWYYNPSTKKLRIYSTSSPTNVKISTLDDLVTINGSNITIQNIDFVGSNSKTFNITGSTYDKIQNCNISFSGGDAIFGGYIDNTNFTVEGCTITDSNNGGIGIAKYFTNVIIRSNTITNTGTIYGASAITPNANGAERCYGVSLGGANSLIELNTIEYTGYVGIRFNGNNTIVQKNLVTNNCLTCDDGGAIYTWNGPNVKVSGLKVLNNIIVGTSADGSYNGGGELDAGIYLDDYSNGIELADNTIIGCGMGIYLHDAHDVIVQRNTTFNNDVGLRGFGVSSPFYMVNITNNNNIYLAKTAGQLAIHFDPVELVKQTLVSDYNYYARPILDNTTIGGYVRTPSFQSLNHTIAQWQSYLGKDANSKKSAQAVSNENDLKIEYNATSSAKTVSLSQPMIDVKDAKYAGSITLQPFTSVVLMKDNNPATISSVSFTEYKSICEGSSYNGWSTSGTYKRTLTAKSGSDSIVTTYLTVNPKYLVNKTITINDGENYNGWTTSGQYSQTFSSVTGCDSIVIINLTVLSSVGGINSGSGNQKFVKGINFNGGTVTIEGNQWSSYANAIGLNVGTAIGDEISTTWIPTPINSDFSNMLNTFIYSPATNLNVSLPIDNGTYQIYLYTVENYSDAARGSTLILEGNSVPGEIGRMSLNTWKKYGPYEVTTTDGELNVDLVTNGYALLSGLSIFTAVPESPVYNTEYITINKGENYNGWITTGTYSRTLTSVILEVTVSLQQT